MNRRNPVPTTPSAITPTLPKTIGRTGTRLPSALMTWGEEDLGGAKSALTGRFFSPVRATAEDLKRFHAMFNVREVPYDPKFAAYFAATLLEAGLPMVEITQTASHFTLPKHHGKILGSSVSALARLPAAIVSRISA